MQETTSSKLGQIANFLRIHKLQLVLLLSSFASNLVAFGLFAKVHSYEASTSLVVKETLHEKVTPIETDESPEETSIVVDISGAVHKPGAITLEKGSRLSEALESSGGLADYAAFAYFSRNFNEAKILQDQEKIYIPSQSEVDEGVFAENRYMVLSKEQDTNVKNVVEEGSNSLISINMASQEDLESLDGVGPVTANKIIDGRPYEALIDLKEKSVISDSLFNKIKDGISL